MCVCVSRRGLLNRDRSALSPVYVITDRNDSPSLVSSAMHAAIMHPKSLTLCRKGGGGNNRFSDLFPAPSFFFSFFYFLGASRARIIPLCNWKLGFLFAATPPWGSFMPKSKKGMRALD